MILKNELEDYGALLFYGRAYRWLEPVHVRL